MDWNTDAWADEDEWGEDSHDYEHDEYDSDEDEE